MSILPTSYWERADLETEADRLLIEAGHRIDRDGILYDNAGDRVLSLNRFKSEGLEPEGPEPVSPDYLDRVDRFVAEVTEIASLTRQEIKLVEAIAEGEIWSNGTGISARVASRIGTTRHAVWESWRRAKKKLIKLWATEPEPFVRQGLRHRGEGSDRLVIGQPRLWGPQATAEDRERVLNLIRTG
jgi:hypothetical protein